MRALDYAIREGWASLWRNRGSGTFAVVAIALAMIVLGALLLTTWNIERLLAQWSSSAEFSVYLRDDASSEQRGAIEALVDQSGVVTGHEYISKADALGRFRREFAELASLTNDFDEKNAASVFQTQLALITARAHGDDHRVEIAEKWGMSCAQQELETLRQRQG